jgi:double-stranded uracil-DNA glycosylase
VQHSDGCVIHGGTWTGELSDAISSLVVAREILRLVNRYEPDILAPNLRVVFCGINPATTAAIAGHNFSSASNRFWSVLHRSGFTDVRLAAHEERRLLDYGCGITAVVRRPTARAQEVSVKEFREARPNFEAKMVHFAPRSIAFLGKRAISAMMGEPEIAWGRQSVRIGESIVWVLPNPSGLNRAFTLEALVSAYSELRLSNRSG